MGICGTDYSGYLGKMPFFRYPRIPGHELGIEVLEVGDGVANVAVGDHCSVEPYMNCGNCYACRKGQGNCCESLNVIGVMIDGGLCERFLIRADKLHPSKKLSFEQLALVETLAIGCHATDRGAPEAGNHILIIGAGPIGLSTLEFTRLTGATITVMDMVESRLDFCKSTYNVPHTVQFKGDGSELEQMKEITGGDMYEVVTDATGNNRSMSNALAIRRTFRIVGVRRNYDRRGLVPSPRIASPRDESQRIAQRPPRRLHSNHRTDRRWHDRYEPLDHAPYIV